MDLHVCLSIQPKVHHQGDTISLPDVYISLTFGSDFTLEAESSQGCSHHPFSCSDHCLTPSVKTCGRSGHQGEGKASFLVLDVAVSCDILFAYYQGHHSLFPHIPTVSCVCECRTSPTSESESSRHSLQIPVPTEMLDTIPTEDNDAESSVWQVNPEEYSLFSPTLDKRTFEFIPCFLNYLAMDHAGVCQVFISSWKPSLILLPIITSFAVNLPLAWKI